MSAGFTLRTPDLAYWKEQIKCQAACPVHTDARGYVRAIAEGDFERAYLIARGPNPLASICGRICGAPCEAACRRGAIDQPVSIRALKNFVCERHGPAASVAGVTGLTAFLKDAARKSQSECEGPEELLPLLQALLAGDVPKVVGRSVGIVGGGPAGLAAAHDLALFGFQVTIYESEHTLAGMLAVGVPEYRLPRDLIRAEVDVILGMGVTAVTGCRVGRDIAFEDLRRRHDAVIVAVGLKQSRQVAIPGADAEGVIGGVEFLRDVAVGHPPALGERVVVIGGGNVAYDVGRTVIRHIAMDAARTAIREQAVGSVYLCSLESLEEMPADLVEIEEGEQEGIVRRNGWGPVEILTTTSGHVRGVVFRKCLSVYDAERRFAPTFDDSVRELIECDGVLLCVGQVPNLDFVGEGAGLERRGNGGIACDPASGRTSAADVFVAGDLAHGAKLLIHAVASGKHVARTVYEALTGHAIEFRDAELHLPLPHYQREPGYETQPRAATVTRPVEERLKSQSLSVEVGLDERRARLEASRCLDCGVNTIFDGDVCVACGGCVDVCPESCLLITPQPDSDRSLLLKDETSCIRCALCADRCPVAAVRMERFHITSRPVAVPSRAPAQAIAPRA